MPSFSRDKWLKTASSEIISANTYRPIPIGQVSVKSYTLMFSKPQKTVMYAKFREKPKPITFVTRGDVIRNMGSLLVDLMAAPSPWKLPRIMKTALG